MKNIDKSKLLKDIIDKLIPGYKKYNLPKGTIIINAKDIIKITHQLKKIDMINEAIIVKNFGAKLVHLYYSSPKVEKHIEKKILTKNFIKKYYNKFDDKILQKNKRKKIYKSL